MQSVINQPKQVDILLTASSSQTWLQKNLLLVLTIASVIVGSVAGSLFRLTTPSETLILLIGFPGELLMRALKMLILPLMVSALVIGLATDSSTDHRANSGRMGRQCLMYFTGTSMLSTALGLAMVLVVSPGNPAIKSGHTSSSSFTTIAPDVSTLDALLDLARNLFPENIVEAMFAHTATQWTGSQQQHRELVSKPGTNTLGIIVFFVCVGLLCARQPARYRLLVQWFTILNDITMQLVAICMWYSPIGIASLIAGKLLAIDNVWALGAQLGVFMALVCIGCLVYGFLVLPGLYWLVVRQSPVPFFVGILQAWVTALGTSSSAATLPVLFRCLEDGLKIDKQVTQFVLPLTMVFHKTGTSMFIAIASLFIAQINGQSLNPGQLILTLVTSVAASMSGGLPSGSMVTIVLVLSTLGLPATDVSIIIAVDWLLDRIRTSINILGNAYITGIN
ncbi:excitatory amino acid transporter 2-like [Oppia nitens]|uniref:excitatory amino acid transporter 2-like n=1 Tax=Oppia nitens TaxID=1686743 RepID=UPI0023DA6D1D|nr:excitatory amino acid transporter 2-like [Oppia nitens]